ncbi:hypothetical protein BDN70DRAFT_930858 [Pholiota conissans]|uniref:Uncharacterized protein n=1 Tax=Pholiota conissans TaxID=109636 RepID=A0A9P5Z5Q6_9AGAR|nr:hypothetical protein BDN70DRAFT_930858 [Pholiota conissans]
MAPVSSNAISLEDIWLHQSYAGFLALNSAVALGIVLWDYIQLLPEERSIYDNLRGPEWHSPEPWAFILLRYSAILSSLCSILYSSVKINGCQIALSVGQAASVIVVASSGVLFCCRVGAMWDYKKVPVVVYSTTCLITTFSWIAVATQNKISADGPDLPFGTNCRFEHLSEWTPISYALSTAFACLIFGMALTKMIITCTMVATNTGWTLINRACLIYLFFAAVSSIAVLVVYSIEMPTDLLKRTAAPYFVMILMSMGSRIFLNLRLHDNTITRLEESNHFTAKTWTLEDGKSSPLSIQMQPQGPRSEPSSISTLSSAPRGEVRSLQTYITTETLTVPDTGTQASFQESSSYYADSPQSPRSLATANFSDTQGAAPEPRRVDSVRSFVTASTRLTTGSQSVVSDVPEIPKRGLGVRMDSVKSVSSSSTHRTGQTVPPSPRRKPVPSMKSFETTSTRLTASSASGPPPPRPPRRVHRMNSFRYFATTSNLNSDELKSTWHGI